MNKLTVKQKRFCDLYIETGNATESATRAGYSKKTANVIGSENLMKPYIKDYIDERLKLIESKKIATAAEVLEYLTGVVRGTETERVVSYDNTTCKWIEGESPPKLTERTKAAELLGKRYALFIDKKEVGVSFDKSLEDYFSSDEE